VTSPDVIVIGAGVLGLCTAAELGARGHAVTVLDPGGPNASSVAAGMIAPALESLIEGLSPREAAFLKAARDLWPAFAARHSLALHQEGAEWRGPDPDADIARLQALGFAATRTASGVLTSDDWRVEVGDALDRLGEAPGVAREAAWIVEVAGHRAGWRVTAGDGRSWSARTLVLATGAAAAPAGLAPGVAGLLEGIEPIRGQLVPIACIAPPRVLRAPGVYAVPSPDGALVGATMEAGRRDLEPDLGLAARQVEAGVALMGGSGEAGAPRVGIRGASPDGLPLAGPAGEPGLHLALAPRRNGWLLGPLVARIVADGIEGGDPPPEAAALDPLRFA
jgi:glycine oxidase